LNRILTRRDPYTGFLFRCSSNPDTLNDFVDSLKPLLASENNSITPVVRHARIQGPFRATWLPDQPLDLVLTDGEGIGHDTREDKILSSRHLDYFYNADQIILIEDAERPFTGAGKGAIAGIARNGYLPRFHLCFCRLDLVEGDTRRARIRDVNAGLRNVLNALSEENVQLTREDLSISHVGDLDKNKPDDESIGDIVQMLRSARELSTATERGFARPQYDFELISAFLDRATQDFRDLWDGYLFGRGGAKQPWQAVKAFNRRMVWMEDGYKSLQPTSELHSEITKRLSPFFASAATWETAVTPRLQRSSIDALRQEFAQLLKEMIRETLLAAQHGNWESALELSGKGSTFDRAQRIVRIVSEVAPPLTIPNAAWIKTGAAISGRLVGATEEEVQAAIAAVGGALAHPILRRAAASARKGRLRRESPVLLRLDDGSLVEGTVDLAFHEDTSDFVGWTVVDFKTDREFEATSDRYIAQVRVYSEAVSVATGRRRGASFLCSDDK
jgi:hypothetical protein